MKTNRLRLTLGVCFLVGGPLVAAQTVPRLAPNSQPGRTPQAVLRDSSPDRMTHKQQKDLLKYKFEKMREDVDELAKLATSLQKEVGETTENVLSLEVIEKAEQIEKLAKKIKNNARGY